MGNRNACGICSAGVAFGAFQQQHSLIAGSISPQYLPPHKAFCVFFVELATRVL